MCIRDRVWMASLGSGAIGAAIAIVTALRRWDALRTGALVVIAYFVLGTFLAMPSAGLYLAVPTLRSLVGTARYSPAEGMARNVPNTKYAITTSAPVRSASHRRSAVTMAIAAPIAPEPSDAIQTLSLIHISEPTRQAEIS